jgi:hypothetical protein
VSFQPRDLGGARIGLELEYELKERKAPGVDLFFIRRLQRESLQRTLRRFRAELAAEDQDLI